MCNCCRWNNKHKSLARGLCALIVVGHLLANLCMSLLLAKISHHNYPGGEALHHLNTIAPSNQGIQLKQHGDCWYKQLYCYVSYLLFYLKGSPLDVVLHGHEMVFPSLNSYSIHIPYMCQQDAQRLSRHGHQCSRTIPAFATIACVLAPKLHMLNFCEACAAICCYCNIWELIIQDTKKIFCPLKKRAKLKTKAITAFGKSLFLTQYRMRYAIYMPSNTKDLAINLTMVAYENGQNAITFT